MSGSAHVTARKRDSTCWIRRGVLDDPAPRPYVGFVPSGYRRPTFTLPRLSSVVRKLIAGFFVAYVLQLVLENWLGLPVVSVLAMSPGSSALWQLVTYPLVDLSHPIMFLIGLVFIWWALSPFEIGYGPRRTLQLCAASVLAAGIPAWLIGLAMPGSPMLFGSHPLWFGGIAAITWLQRDQQISLFGALSMTAKQFLLLLLGMSVLMFLASKNHTQLVADLGAMAGGIGFVRWMKRPRKGKPVRKPASRARGFKVIRGGGGGTDDEDRPKWLN